jgi:hypothetical protein
VAVDRLGPVPVTPGADAPAPTQADTAGPLAPRPRRRSDQRSRQAWMERRRAARVASQRDAPAGETATAPAGESTVPEPRFPHGMRNAAMAYASSASTDVAAYKDLPGHHLRAARNLIATTNDESFHGSASERPPTTSHGYAEWDFSGLPDPVMFQRFLDAVDYWFGYSDNSSAGSYDPAHECFVVVVDDQANGANAAGLATEKPLRTWELDYSRARGQARPHLTGEGCLHQRAAGPSARARGQACGGVLRGATALRLHRWRSFRARRMLARAGQVGARSHQR